MTPITPEDLFAEAYAAVGLLLGLPEIEKNSVLRELRQINHMLFIVVKSVLEDLRKA